MTRSNQDHTIMLHTYNTWAMSPPSNNFLHFMVSHQTKFKRSRSLRQDQMLNQGHTMTLHTYNSQLMSLPSINFLYLMVAEIQPGQNIIGQGHHGQVKDQIKVTP